MDRWDVIIIGAGPAGLSAAITLKIRNKSVLVIGNQSVSEKVEHAHEINNYLGMPAVKGSDLAAAFLDHAKQMNVPMVDARIHSVYSMGAYYSLQSSEGDTYEATAVVLATGVSFGKPYPGELEYLGRGVSYCATCDAPLYKEKRIVIVADSPKEEAEASFMAEICSEVLYVPTYASQDADIKHRLVDKVQVITGTPLEIKGDRTANTLVLTTQELKVDGIFLLRESVSPAQLVPGLAMDGNHIKVDRQLRTNLKGCFACGDITGTPYQYIKSAGEGNVAAISVVEYLSELAKQSK